jgi:hypothetical protein
MAERATSSRQGFTLRQDSTIRFPPTCRLLPCGAGFMPETLKVMAPCGP